MKINLDNLFISSDLNVQIQCLEKDEAAYTLQRILDALNLMDEIERAVNNEQGIHYDLLIKNSKSYFSWYGIPIKDQKEKKDAIRYDGNVSI